MGFDGTGFVRCRPATLYQTNAEGDRPLLAPLEFTMAGLDPQIWIIIRSIASAAATAAENAHSGMWNSSKTKETKIVTTTNEIADKIATEQGVNRAQAKAIVESIFRQISDAASSGTETSIPGFGKFKVKDTPARDGRNPSTGATIKIAASKKLSFVPAKAIKDALNG
jgi:DNA-binding protein HU-beta